MADEEDKQKISELEDKIEELREAVNASIDEGGQETLEDSGFIDVKINGRNQTVHYIKIEELVGTEFDECEKIKTSQDAQEAFRLAFIYRAANISEYPAPVGNGDYLILECQGKKVLFPESDSSEEVPDGCYYVGMCVIPDSGIQNIGCGRQEPQPEGFSCLTDEFLDGGDAIRSFSAWNTCGIQNECEEELDDGGEPVPKYF